MSRFRLVLLGIMAVLVMSAVVADAAFAEGPVYQVCKQGVAGSGVYEDPGCTTPGGAEEWSWATLSPFEEKEVVSEGGPFKLETELLGTPITIECEKEKDETLIFGTEPGFDDTTVAFRGECHVVGVACTVAEPIVVDQIPSILRYVLREEVEEKVFKYKTITEEEYKKDKEEGKSVALADEFKPSSGKAGVFVVIKLSGCLLAGEQYIEGTELGIVNNEKEELEFKGTETSGLKFHGEKASITGIAKRELVAGVGLRVEV